jgi:hypothetical protein
LRHPYFIDSGFNQLQAVIKNILNFTATGLVAGVALGWLLSLGSGNYFVTLGVTVIGTSIGLILGIVHRNDRRTGAATDDSE